jgi:hypothetical protein
MDISRLATFQDVIAVKDINSSDKIQIMTDPETIVASVQEPRSEEELSALDQKVEEDVSKVEGVVKEEPAAEGEKQIEEKK